jgi:WD40 repeat protein
LLAVATLQGVSLLDLATGSERAFLVGAGAHVLFEPSGALLTVRPGGRGLHRWPVRADEKDPLRLKVGPPERVPIPGQVDNLARSGDGMVLAVAAYDGARVWRRDRPLQALHLRPHPDCRYVTVSPDGKLVATGAHNGLGLKVWDAHTGKLIRDVLPRTGPTGPAFSPDGRWLFNNDGQSWRVEDWSPGPRYLGRLSFNVTFAPDTRLAAWGGQKGFIPLVDPATGRELARLEDPHQDGMRMLTFSPDGTLLIGVTNDSFCVRVWDLRKLRQALVELGLDWDALPYPPDDRE